MTLLAFAEQELKAARLRDGDEERPSRHAVDDALLEVVRVFSQEGHSGGSAAVAGPWAANALLHLLTYRPLTPIEGKEGEWVDVAEEMIGRPGVQQNNRCSRVFREWAADVPGARHWIAYDVEAVIFTGRHDYIQSWDSKRKISFPYVPETRYTRFRYLSRWWARITGKLITN